MFWHNWSQPLFSTIVSLILHGCILLLALNSSADLQVSVNSKLNVYVNSHQPKEIFNALDLDKVSQQRATKHSVSKQHIAKQKSILAKENQISELKSQFLADLRYLIEKQKYYPASAKALKQVGAVKLGFSILENGKIIDVKVIQSSNHPILDIAAIKTIEKIGFYLPLPEAFNAKKLDLIQKIKYEL